jgi:hypothetical protein
VDFDKLNEFNKYTLAVAAGGFVYTLETFVPNSTFWGRVLVLCVLVAFLVATLAGVVLFAVSTVAGYGDAARRARVAKLVPGLGMAHVGFLCLALLALGGMIYPRVMSEPEPPATHACSCRPPAK